MPLDATAAARSSGTLGSQPGGQARFTLNGRCLPGDGWSRPVEAWMLALLCAVFGLLELKAEDAAADVSPTEYQLKAAMLHKFTLFATWPTNAFTSANAPLIVAVLGEDPFGLILDRAFADKRLGERRIEVRRFASGQPIGDCHLLFIARSEASRVGQVLTQLASRPVLTVSDMDAFAERGGILGLVKSGTRIALEVNLAAAERARVSISSRLLSLKSVRIVGRPKDGADQPK